MPANAGAKRSPAQREHDLAEVARRYLHGESQAGIGADVGVSQQQISYDLGILRGRWAKSALMAFDERFAQELAGIDELERTYWDAWQRSMEERTVTETRKRSTPRGEITEAMMRREKSHGNAAFLAGVERCKAQRIELLSLVTQGDTSAGKSGSLAALVQILKGGEASSESGGTLAGNDSPIPVGETFSEGEGLP